MFGKAKNNRIKRLQSLLLAILFTISLLPPIEARAVTGTGTQENPYIFTEADGAVVLTEEYSGTNVIIQGNVFSVTVKDAVDINIIFDNVYIDRRAVTDTANGGLSGKTVPNLYAAAQKLGWGNKAPVCPFLVTGTASVTVGFRGNCTFYAGTNSCTVNNNSVYTAYYVNNSNNHTNKGCGYAGIQVDKDATLTIQYAENLKVYGAHQLDSPDADGKVSNGMDYAMVLRANASISDAGYVNPYGSELYNVLNSHQQFIQSGGAGIGGGAAYNTTSSATTDYTQGTPGTIIINGGKIEAFGGYAAAGIGGGVNSAATATSITINGGNVIAHGGRFAAGIGDGDSVPNENSTGMSNALVESTGRIEINGGNVESYGGVAAPGIGCSDDICESSKGHGADARSLLEIAINGGVVRAFSGFPSGYTGGTNFPNEAPAAIGAGSISQMQSNSIYISSAADLLCAAFGNYSLTEIGTDGRENVTPTINVDSDGYLLLLRTGNYYAKEERFLKLWKPQTVEIPDIGTCAIYTVQSTGAIYYCCNDEDGNRLIYQKNGENYVRITQEVVGLTLYVNEDPAKGPVSEPLTDENGKQLQIDLYYFFRSMAITLPEPEKHGGLYAITVPTNGVSNSSKPSGNAPIILTVEAFQQGTQSGKITYPSNHNMSLDDTADRLTDLDVYPIESPDGLIGDEFNPGVFAYTVYVEPDVDEVTLWAKYDEVAGVSYTLSLDGQRLYPTDNGNTQEVSVNVNLTGVTSKTVRLKKQDGTNALGAIVYKVTIIKKGQYRLELSAPSKVYDGNPANVLATGASKTIVVSSTLRESTGEPLPPTEITGGTNSTVTFQQNSTVLIRRSSSRNYSAALTMKLDVRPQSGSLVAYVLTITAAQSGNNTITVNRATSIMGWLVDYDESKTTQITDPSTVGLTSTNWITTEDLIAIASYNTYNLQLQVDSSGSVDLLINGTSQVSGVFFQIADTSATSTTTSNRDEQETLAWEALEKGVTDQEFPYASYKETVLKQNLTAKRVTVSSNSNSASTQTVSPITVQTKKEYTAAGKWMILVTETQTIPVSVTEEELEDVSLKYYKIGNPDGTPCAEEPLGETPPVDAGKYRVEAELRTTTYNATANQRFTIERREVRVQQITNWLKYADTLPGDPPLAIPNPGQIILENVVAGDSVSINDTVIVYYNDTSFTYGSQKITLENATLTGPDAKYKNYTLYYDDTSDKENPLIFVFGQISWTVQGSTFRKTATGSWRKYYPSTDGNPVGTSGNNPDYHSPLIGNVYRAHSEYVLARTVNHNSGTRYAVDIEYGAMQFGFYRGMWDVNQLVYVENVDSIWTGMDGKNNRIVLTNYSNAEVLYQIAASIDFLYAAQSGSSVGISARITADSKGMQTIGKTTWTSVAAATPGDSVNNGSSGSGECYLFLSGVPQMQESSTYIEVGTIKVTVAPAGHS